MPVPPSSPSVGSRYPSYTSYTSSYRSPSSSSYSGRTSSPYSSSYSSGSSYTSSYGSGYTSKYTRPPLPSYSYATDSYRSSRSLRQSPVRSSYSSRLNADSNAESSSASPSRYTSRYGGSSSYSSSRDLSSSRDSGYTSRYSSRDRSNDAVNGNIDSSYIANFYWREKDMKEMTEKKDKNKEKDKENEEEKVRVTDRIRIFEPPKSSGGGFLGGRESTLSSYRDSNYSSSISRTKASSPEKDTGSSISYRHRIPLTLVDVPRTSPGARKTSPDTDEDTDKYSKGRRPSVTELCQKYDTNHNIPNGVKQSDEEDASDGSSSGAGDENVTAEPIVESITIARTGRPRTSSTSRSRPEKRDSSINARTSRAEGRDSSISARTSRAETRDSSINRLSRTEGRDTSLSRLSRTEGRDTSLTRVSRAENRDSSLNRLSHTERRDSSINSRIRDSSINSRLDSSATATTSRSRQSSPVGSRYRSTSSNRYDSANAESSVRSGVTAESSRDLDGSSSPYINGALDKPKTRGKIESSIYDTTPTSTYRRSRQDRVRERIAARLAYEDDGSPPRRHQSAISSSSSSLQSTSSTGSSTGGGVCLSENNGLVGLRNIGNTCFMNSITQCLSNTRYLLEYLVQDGSLSDINTTISTMKGDLVRAFANLLQDMWTEGGDSNRAVNTAPFKSQIQRFAPAFTGYQQHDAQEFLRKLLEGLHEDVNRVTAKPTPITTDIDDDLSDNQKAIESWKRYLRYDDSKIVDMFVGQLRSCLQCSVCGHQSVTFDPFWDLSLPIPSKTGQVRLSQCLELFTKEEVLDGDERPTCSKCKERRKMTKYFSIQKFPKVLVLHLKRFSPLERWRGKLSCTVEFPLDNLDISKFASSSTSSPMYNLIGVANHSGTTYSGHYTAYCKHPYQGEWNEYNDSRVSKISPRRICSPEAYVLFYEMSSSLSKL